MQGEFNGICARYYQLTQLLENREALFTELLINALPYYGQSKLSELDAIIQCNREVQRVKAETEKIAMKIRDTEYIILTIMEYFSIPRGTKLTGEIPEELEFEIWVDEQDRFYLNKTKDLAPPPTDENVITIKFASMLSGWLL